MSNAITVKQLELINAANKFAATLDGGFASLTRKNRAAAKIEGSKEWACLQCGPLVSAHADFSDEECQKLLDCLK